MKRNKRWLSIVLAVVMALSSLTAAVTAFAASTKEDVETAITNATGFDQAVVDKFNDCGEKSAIDKALVTKLFLQVFNEKKVVYGSTVYVNGKATLDAINSVLELTADMKAGFEAAFYFGGLTSKTVAVPEAGNQTVFFPTMYDVQWNSYKYTDYINLNASGMPDRNKDYADAATAHTILKDGVAAYNALSADAKAYGNQLAVGAFTSNFAQDEEASMSFGILGYYASYLTGVENVAATALYTQLTAGMQLPAELAAAGDKFAAIAEKAEAYRTDAIGKEEFVAFAEENTQLTDAEIIFSKQMVYLFWYNGALNTPQQLITVMTNALAEGKYELFLEALANVDLAGAGSAAFNAKVGELMDEYKALADIYKAAFNANTEMYSKYYQILGLYTGDKTIPNMHESFEKQNYAGNPLINNTVDSAVAAIKDMLPQILGGLLGTDEDLKTFLEGQFTNYNATYLLATINNTVNDLLAGLDLGMSISLTIDETVKLLGSDYPEFTAALDKRGPDIPGTPAIWVCMTHGTQGSDAEVNAHVMEKIMSGDYTCYPLEAQPGTPDQPGERIYKTWNDVLAAMETEPELYNWGITEGDFGSFVDALLAGLRPLTSAVAFLLPLVNSSTSANGQVITTYGPYENLVVPLLEALGANNVMSSAEYTAQYVSAFNLKQNNDTMFKPILMQVYEQVLIPLMNDPVDYLLKNLPNIAYHLDDGCITGSLLNIISSLGLGLENDPIVSKLTNFKSIVEMVYSLIANGDIAAELTADQQATADQIYNLIAGLAKTGTPVQVDTVSAKAQKTIKVEADIDNMVNYLVTELVNIFGLEIDFAVKGEFIKTEAPQYPHNGKMDKEVINAMINGLDGIIGGFINIGDAINNGLCTQEMAANAITAIYGLLNSDGVAGIFDTLNLSFKPSVVAKALTEDKYRELAAALTFTDPALDSWSNVGLVIKNDNTIIDQTDMGFKDGDRQGFVDCLIAALRPISAEISQLLVNGTLSDGTTNYGLYETIIIPLFEALGLTPAANSATVTDNFNKLLKKADKNGAYDYILKTILAPVMDLLDDLAAAPAATLLSLLPNLAYAAQYSKELAFIGNLVNANGGLAALVNGLISNLLPGFELPALNLDALASCGTVVEKNSKSALREKYTAVAPDSADAFVTVFYYLYDAMTYRENMAVVKNLLAGMEGIDETLSSLIDGILNDVFTKGKEEALCAIGTLLASDVWECPDEAGNNGGKTPNTGDYTVPVAVVLAVMFTAGAAIVVLRKKKVNA